MAVVHPGDEATLGFTLLAFGDPVLFLVAQALFARGALGRVPRSRTWALAALVVLAVATAPLTLIAGIAASSAVLVAVAVADTVREGVRAGAVTTHAWPGARARSRCCSTFGRAA